MSARQSYCLTPLNNGNNTFRRQLSIAERKLDPQTAIINNPPPVNNHLMSNSITLPALSQFQFNNETTDLNGFNSAKPRPFVNTGLFERQVNF